LLLLLPLSRLWHFLQATLLLVKLQQLLMPA
jgi:hypothetical protein